jgi:hypothetical protein
MKPKTRILLFILLVLSGILLSGCLEDESDDESIEVQQTPEEVSPTSAHLKLPQKGYAFGVEDVSFEEVEDLQGWFDKATTLGINVISFSPFNLEGGALIDSQPLREAGFKPEPEVGYIFPEILRQAKQHDMTVIVMLEGIAHIKSGFMPYSEDIKPEKLTTRAVQDLIFEIAKEAEKQNAVVAVDEEGFDDTYVNAIREATLKADIPYLRFFEDLTCQADGVLSEDFAYYPRDARGNSEDQQYLRHLLNMGSYYGELGNLNLMYAAAKACDVPAYTLTAGGWGMGARTHQNIALFRALQYNPQMYMFTVGEGDQCPIYPEEPEYVENYNFKAQLQPLLEEFAGTQGQKPVANLIIDPPSSQGDIQDFFLNAELSSMSAITNAMLSAGYDIVATKTPYPDAALYYVFSSGLIFEEGDDLPAELAELAEGDTAVFYQVAGELPDKPNWNRVKEKLGLKNYQVLVNDDEASFFDPIPESVEYFFPEGRFEVKYGGYSFEVYNPEHVGRFSVGHYLHYINPDEIDGEVLLAGKTAKDGDSRFDDTTALIIRRGNVYFVNGGYLHLAASSILANIMAGRTVYNKPSYGYFTNGEKAVFYTPYDVEVDLKVFGGHNVTEFDEAGNRITPRVTLEDGRLQGRVERFHLVVVT